MLPDPTDTGEVTDQQVTLDDTNGTVVGNPASQATPDGFVLRGSCTGSASPDCQLIVFMGTATGTGFGKGAAGFVTDVNDVQTDTDGFGNNQQLPGHEICDDKVDNDGDRLVDCADPDCLGAQSCTSTGPAASPGRPRRPRPAAARRRPLAAEKRQAVERQGVKGQGLGC